MKRLSARLLATLVVSLAAAASSARADFMNWGYSTTATPPVISSGTGTVQMTGITKGTAADSIPLLGLQDSSAATSGSPDVYHSTYSLALTFTDNTTHDSGTLTLTGLLQGKLTATTSSVTNTVTGPTSLTLDGHVYTVSIPSLLLTVPGTPQQTLNATVTVSNASGGGTQTPEPTSLLLGGLGLTCAGLGCWWKRLRRSAA
jgi:hypothetical protein